jgi:hypothetical protein
VNIQNLMKLLKECKKGEMNIMKKIISLLMVMVFMSCAMEPVIEDVVIFGYTEGDTLYTESIQLSANVSVTWTVNNGSVDDNGVVTATGSGEIVVTATSNDDSTDLTLVFEDFRLVGEWKRTHMSGDDVLTFNADGTYHRDNVDILGNPTAIDGTWYTTDTNKLFLSINGTEVNYSISGTVLTNGADYDKQ